MGGEIWVESELGVGSTFQFTVGLGKCVDASPLENAQSQTVEDDVNKAIASLRGAKILLVEDNIVNQLLVSELLNNPSTPH